MVSKIGNKLGLYFNIEFNGFWIIYNILRIECSFWFVDLV